MARKWKDLTLKEKFFEALDEGKNQWQGEETIDAFKESVDELLRQSGVALEDTRAAARLQMSANNETLFKETVAGIYCAHPENRREFEEKLQNEITFRETIGNQDETINDNKIKAEEEAGKIKTAAEEIRKAVGNIQSQQIGKKVEEAKKEREVAEKAINGAKEEAKQSISKAKNLSSNIKKRKTVGKVGRWAMIAVLLVAVAVVCALSIAGACLDGNEIEEMNDTEKFLLGSGIAGVLVDVIGLISGIVFFVYERRTDKKEGVSAKIISQQLDDIQTCIDGIQADGTKLDDLTNAVQTMSKKVEGIGGKAANIVATSTNISSIVNQISNVSQTIIQQYYNYAAPEKEIVEKPIEVCPSCQVPLLPCKFCGYDGKGSAKEAEGACWEEEDKTPINKGAMFINKEEVVLANTTMATQNDRLNAIVFGPKVKSVELGGDSDTVLNIRAIEAFKMVSTIGFSKREKENYCKLGNRLFDNIARDMSFIGLEYVSKVGDNCFGGIGQDSAFVGLFNQAVQQKLKSSQAWREHSQKMQERINRKASERKRKPE